MKMNPAQTAYAASMAGKRHAQLLAWLPKGSTVYAIRRHTTRSKRGRSLDLYVLAGRSANLAEGQPLDVTVEPVRVTTEPFCKMVGLPTSRAHPGSAFVQAKTDDEAAFIVRTAFSLALHQEPGALQFGGWL